MSTLRRNVGDDRPTERVLRTNKAMKRLLFAAALLCSGCGVKHVQVRRGEVVIDNDCIQKLEKTDKTFCHGPDGAHVKCENVQLVRDYGCEKFQVNQKSKEKK